MEGAEGRRNRHRKECMTKAAVSLTIPPLLLCTKNKLEIRSRPLLEPGSDYHDSVRVTGLEPVSYSSLKPRPQVYPLCLLHSSCIYFSIIMIIFLTKTSFFLVMQHEMQHDFTGMLYNPYLHKKPFLSSLP